MGRPTAPSTTWWSNSRSRTLQQNLQSLFPGEDIQVSTSDDSTMLSGQVSSTNVMLRAGEIATGVVGEALGHQPPAGAWRQREPAGAAAGPLRRGESARAPGAWRVAVRGAATFPGPIDDAAVFGAELRRRNLRDPTFSDFLNLFFFDRQEGSAAFSRRLQQTRRVPEPGRAEPDCLQRPGGQLPGRRRISGSGRAGRDRHGHRRSSRNSASG